VRSSPLILMHVGSIATPSNLRQLFNLRAWKISFLRYDLVLCSQTSPPNFEADIVEEP